MRLRRLTNTASEVIKFLVHEFDRAFTHEIEIVTRRFRR
jgi:hypothetical protein